MGHALRLATSHLPVTLFRFLFSRFFFRVDLCSFVAKLRDYD
jgi:hypothetical protein